MTNKPTNTRKKAAPKKKAPTAKKKAPTKKRTVKRRVGRPELYSVGHAKKLATSLPGYFKNGESVAEVCVALDCSKDSFYKMVDICPEFSDAYKKGLDLSEAWWSKLGRAGSAGKVKIQPATWIFNMKNRFKWVDRQEVTGKDGGSLFSNFAQAVLENQGDDK